MDRTKISARIGGNVFKSMAYNGLRLEITDDRIAIVTMCNGDNTFNMDYLQTWHKVIDDIERARDIKGLITTGEGKVFSTGLDITWLKQNSPRMLDIYHDELHRLYRRVISLGVTTVAAVNGHAIAEGAFLALVHDYRVMRSDRVWIQWPEVHLKLPFTKTMVDIARLKMSPAAHREAVVFGKRLDGRRAKDLGVVDAHVPEEQLMPTALKTIQTALGKYIVEPHFFTIMKKDFYNDFIAEETLAAKL